jgi:hypothetical protein
MTRVLFREADVKRAVKGAKAGGLDVGRVEIDAQGRIVILARGTQPETSNEVDEWFKRQDARKAQRSQSRQ